MMKAIRLLYNLFFIFFIYLFSASCIAQNIVFSATPSRDRMEIDSVFSKDANYFTTKGSAQVGIYSRAPYKRVGSVCCHKGEDTQEIFLKSNDESDRLLQVKMSSVEGIGVLTISIYGVDGQLLAGPQNLPIAQERLISASPSKGNFVVLSDKNLIVYDSALKKVKEYNISTELKKVESITLSNAGSSALIKDSTSLIFIDLHLNVELSVKSCDIPADGNIKMTADEEREDRFILVSDLGEVCILNQNESRRFKLRNFGGLIGVHSTDSMFYILTEGSISAFKQDTLLEVSSFDLPSYYKKQFGMPSAHERPIFLNNEFDGKNNTFYLQGHPSTKIFYKINVINQ